VFRKLYICFVCLTISACATPKSYYPEVDKGELQMETYQQQELAANKKAVAKEEAQFNRSSQQQRLTMVSSRILKGGSELCMKIAAPNAKCIYPFELSDEKDLNAYADDKRIVVSPAMMDFAGTDEELAIVLGHEYAHLIMRHIASKQRNVMLGNVVGVILDTAASTQGIGTGGTFGKLGATAGALQYSKEFEKEADYIGLYVTYLSGYNIDNASELWRKMSLRDPKSIKEAYTHPSNPERYLALKQTIAEIKRKEQSGSVLLPNLK
jgi:predicted Zn-dependent protease